MRCFPPQLMIREHLLNRDLMCNPHPHAAVIFVSFCLVFHFSGRNGYTFARFLFDDLSRTWGINLPDYRECRSDELNSAATG